MPGTGALSIAASTLHDATVAGAFHLDEDTVLGLTEGFLTEAERDVARQHLDTCVDCARLVSTWTVSEVQNVAPGQTFGRFVVLQEVGNGSVGRVWAAWDPVLNRKVALKVLRNEVRPVDRAQALLMREAQALARLTHPNVVGVHDAGTERGVAYLAMEFVEGNTFVEWLRRAERPVIEIVHRFAEACEGLAAAHRVGLLHRDFKPSNLLVGTDGRLRVADFGLAALAQEASGASATPQRIALNSSLTDTGALVGTPAYLAPELWEGHPASSASDQFSVAVALFEALTGAQPFRGDTVAERLASIRAGPQWPSETPGISRALKNAVMRGLKFNPADRFASLELFGRALVRFERRWLRLVAIGVTAVLLIATGFSGVFWERNRSRCADLAVQFNDVWDARAKADLAEVYAKAAQSSSFESVASLLDRWTLRWLSAREHTCRAEMSTGLPQRASVSCLEEQRRLLAALIEDLHHADPATLRQGQEAIASLPPASLCSPNARTAPTAEPEVGQGLAAAKSALVLARWEEAETRAQGILKRAQTVGAPGSEAAALVVLADVKYHRGTAYEAEAAFREAILKAERAGANQPAVDAWVRLAYVVGVGEQRFHEGLLLADFADAIAAVRGDAAQRAELEFTRAQILHEKGDFAEALSQSLKAEAALAQAYGANDWRIGKAENVEGQTLRSLSRFDEALDAFWRAEVHLMAALPVNHYGLFTVRENRAVTLASLGRLDEGEALIREVLEGELAAMPAHRSVALTYLNLGWVLEKQHLTDEALESYREALRRAQNSFGPNDAVTARVLLNIASLLSRGDQADEALRLQEQALSILTKTLGPEHIDVAEALKGLAMTYAHTGRCREAIPRYEQALTAFEKNLGDSVALDALLLGLSECWLELKQYGAAQPMLERVVRSGENHRRDPEGLAKAQFMLSRVLVETHANASRAKKLAEQAQEQADEQGAASVTDWRRRQGWVP